MDMYDLTGLAANRKGKGLPGMKAVTKFPDGRRKG